MKTLDEIMEILEQKKPSLCKEFGIKTLGVFGSYVQGNQNPESDIDILLELEKPIRIDLIALIELEYQLSDLLGVKVDLVIKDNRLCCTKK
jgi:predicted nucleotidyltransferase